MLVLYSYTSINGKCTLLYYIEVIDFILILNNCDRIFANLKKKVLHARRVENRNQNFDARSWKIENRILVLDARRARAYFLQSARDAGIV